MIEIINPAWLAMVVDGGRYGYADIGVPPSSVLDRYAYTALCRLLGYSTDIPVLEIMGHDFSLKVNTDVSCAITGARVTAFVDSTPAALWKGIRVKAGSTIEVKEVTEGLRYYLGFSGIIDAAQVTGSYTTNLECRFGGYFGRPFLKGDRIALKDIHIPDERVIDESLIPSMQAPHLLRIIAGEERDRFSPETLKSLFEIDGDPWYKVSTKSNRTGIRLEGRPLEFKEEVERSIISEGILPGIVQIPGDGQPIIVLYERTIGGYARIGHVAKTDRDLLAHLKPLDKVRFQMIEPEEAERLWDEKITRYYDMLPK
ncbi:MAG: biotin-dependent carboxyltransferase family protein [Syntrophorhabdaceae bacterium]|nr:biotin-dependent carboxyltransferase family protein [Syntrophorhabdaceae bacterium]MDD5243230.1 biotin-dependent carboxyltransferase family protein [Syntrophorhabdaceae bacterium]